MKNKVLEIVKNRTEKKKIDVLKLYTASYISRELNVSRNLVSQYLNELVREEKLLKVPTRPVYFFHKKTIESRNNIVFNKSTIELDEAIKLIKGINKEKKDFEKLIGNKGSLNYCVKQCKSAISYPPNGLSILLNGPTGTGKSLMAQLMYEYAINNGIIEKKGKFITLNCSEYANNPELLTSNLFGHKQGAFTGADKDNVGLIKAADGGILFLDEVHCLSPESQEKLFFYMDKGIYHALGDNVNWHHSKVRLIFATTEKPEVALLKTLLRRIAIICKIPSLNDRPVSERKELISHMFKDESDRIGKKVFISNAVYKSLLTGKFKGNIGQIKNHIKAGCANAFLQNSSHDFLKVNIKNMPPLDLCDLSLELFEFDTEYDEELIDIEKLNLNNENVNRIIDFYNEIINDYKKSTNKDNKFDDFLEAYYCSQTKFFDSIIYLDRKNIYSKLDFYAKTLESVFEIVKTKYKINIKHNDIISISSFLIEYKKISSEVLDWKKDKANRINLMKDIVQSKLQKEYYMAKKINIIISNSLDITMDDFSEMVLSLILKSYNKELDINRIPAIIISHGYSTASSIADLANKMIGSYIFDAIDMPLGVTSEQIILSVKKSLNELGDFKEVILLVDMGSLEDIYLGIKDDIDLDIGIINNVSTKLALDIGFRLVNGDNLEEILKTSSKNNITTYRYIKNRKKEDVVLSVCPTGIGTSKKIVELIESSLPRKIELKILSVEYSQVITKKLYDDLLDKYNIKLIVGTIDPSLESIPFVPLEGIITQYDIDVFYNIMSNYLTEEEIDLFNNNIIQRFSLNNILKYLTILNAEKVLEVVKSVVNKIETKMNIKIKPKVKIGLYIHLSCLVERLITKSEIKTYYNVRDFVKKEKKFIEIIKEATSEIETYFSVEIPVEEIGYIFDYINSNE